MTDSISLIVPHWPTPPGSDPEHIAECLRRCVISLRVPEKIVVVNDGTGMGKAINQGVACATGSYFIISNNDCQWAWGNVEEMCDPNFITVPSGSLWDRPNSFYCIPRTMWEQVGGYDERFEVGYWEDVDLQRRWEQAGISWRGVNVGVNHTPGTTLNNLPNRQEIYDKNKEKYDAKWDILNLV